MHETETDIEDLHRLAGLLLTIDAGILVVDRAFDLHTWNGFMINHTGIRPERILGRSLFEIFPEIDESWFRNKARQVFVLRSRAFLTWQQRPYLIRLHNYRTITGMSDHMLQNVTLIPLASTTGDVTHMGIIIYDVTEAAEAQLALERLNRGNGVPGPP